MKQNKLKTMFSSIKEKLNSKTQSNNTYNEILKLSVGKTYTVRLLPYEPKPDDTFFTFYTHGWNSFATGSYVQAVSPTTFGERDPIAEYRYKIRKNGTEAEKEKASNIKRIEKKLVNVYVVDDQENPDNNGKVKILRYGRQLDKIIAEAIEDEEYGDRIFDLGPNGVNLRIKVEKQGDYPTYVSSKFTGLPKVNLSESEIEEVLSKTHDLTKVFSVKTFDELKQLLDEHYHAIDSEKEDEDNNKVEEKPVSKSNKEAVSDSVEDTTSSDDASDIDELLANL